LVDRQWQPLTIMIAIMIKYDDAERRRRFSNENNNRSKGCGKVWRIKFALNHFLFSWSFFHVCPFGIPTHFELPPPSYSTLSRLKRQTVAKEPTKWNVLQISMQYAADAKEGCTLENIIPRVCHKYPWYLTYNISFTHKNTTN